MLRIALRLPRTSRRRWFGSITTLALIGCGSSADTPATPATPVGPTGSLTVALSTSSLSVVQGGTQSASATITRVGSVSGSVTVTVDGAPSGVTAATNPGLVTALAATTVQLTVNVAATAPAGTYVLTIHAHAATADGSTTIALTVTPMPSSMRISLSPTAVSVPLGGTATASLAIARTALDAPVDVTVSGLPSGLTVTAQPASVTGTATTLTIAASSGAPAGQYTVVIRATASANLTAIAPLVITVPPAASGVMLTWARCAAPDWVATQDGSGAWTHVLLTAGSVVFQLTATKGSFAYVEGGKSLVVRTMAAGELAGRVLDMCPPVEATKTLAGTDAPPSPGSFRHNFELGGAHAEIAGGGSASFSLKGVRDGTHDLVAWVAGVSLTDKIAIVRDINLPDGGSLEPINLGTDGTNQSLTLATVTNPLASEGYFFSQYYLTTSACTMNPIGTFTQPNCQRRLKLHTFAG